MSDLFLPNLGDRVRVVQVHPLESRIAAGYEGVATAKAWSSVDPYPGWCVLTTELHKLVICRVELVQRAGEAVDRAKAPEPEMYGTMPAELPETLPDRTIWNWSERYLLFGLRRDGRHYRCAQCTNMDGSDPIGRVCIDAREIDWASVPRQPSHPQPVAEGDRLHTGGDVCCLCGGADPSFMRADYREYCEACKALIGGTNGVYREIDRRVEINGQQAQSKSALVPIPPPDPYTDHRVAEESLIASNSRHHFPRKQYGNGDALDRLAAIRRRKVEQLRGEIDRKATERHPSDWEVDDTEELRVT